MSNYEIEDNKEGINPLAVQEKTDDIRNLREYLRDVEETESKGLYPQYSSMRKRILAYWAKAVAAGLVSLDDSIKDAVEKMKSRRKV